ncbi:MAG: OmpH family outer membrane protein [Flavobacterium sp.]|nr:OmpH family outer membrane protein [Flavobacterium sp.]MDI9366454.1 OmpH family outer membrane protein [Flavobacterium sp.]
MKNFTIGLNAALVIAVAVLFYLQFSNKKTVAAPSANAASGSFRIAYFVEDSLQSDYAGFDYYVQKLKEVAINDEKLRSEMIAKKNQFDAKLREYQAKGQTMTQMEAAKANQDLEQRQKQLQADAQQMNEQSQSENLKIVLDVKKKIEDYLKEYNINKTYAFIMSSSASSMYYKDSTYDITKDLIKGLNEKYPKKK